MHSDNVSTTATETRDRKTTKPIMEKRRRARINSSLSELKSLLLEAIKKEGARHSKMEKADILEMTVKHLRQMQRQHFTVAAAEDPSVMNKYRHGFSECALEVKKYLSSLEDCDTDVKTRLLSHIANCLTGMENSTSRVQLTSPTMSHLPTDKTDEIIIARSRSSPTDVTPMSPITVDVNNNVPTMASLEPAKSGNVFGGLQVIPTQLASGEIAFVLPTNILRTPQVPNYVIPIYTGASSLPKTSPNIPAQASTSFTQVSPSVSPSQCPPSQRFNTISVNCDKSYLPCATVTPVKPVPNHPYSEHICLESKNSGIETHPFTGRRPESDASREEPVWRPW